MTSFARATSFASAIAYTLLGATVGNRPTTASSARQHGGASAPVGTGRISPGLSRYQPHVWLRPSGANQTKESAALSNRGSLIRRLVNHEHGGRICGGGRKGSREGRHRADSRN